MAKWSHFEGKRRSVLGYSFWGAGLLVLVGCGGSSNNLSNPAGSSNVQPGIYVGFYSRAPSRASSGALVMAVYDDGAINIGMDDSAYQILTGRGTLTSGSKDFSGSMTNGTQSAGVSGAFSGTPGNTFNATLSGSPIAASLSGGFKSGGGIFNGGYSVSATDKNGRQSAFTMTVASQSGTGALVTGSWTAPDNQSIPIAGTVSDVGAVSMQAVEQSTGTFIELSGALIPLSGGGFVGQGTVQTDQGSGGTWSAAPSRP